MDCKKVLGNDEEKKLYEEKSKLRQQYTEDNAEVTNNKKSSADKTSMIKIIVIKELDMKSRVIQQYMFILVIKKS